MHSFAPLYKKCSYLKIFVKIAVFFRAYRTNDLTKQLENVGPLSAELFDFGAVEKCINLVDLHNRR